MAAKRPHDGKEEDEDEEIDVCGLKDPGTPDTIPMTDSTYDAGQFEPVVPSQKKRPRKSRKSGDIDMTGLDASGQKVNYGLPENFAALNFRVIAEVGRRRCLYDESHPDYKDSVVRNEAWIDIGLALGMHASFVKTRWKTLRDRCAREERRARAEGRPNSWPFLNAIAFLLPHLKEKGHCSASDDSAGEKQVVQLNNGEAKHHDKLKEIKDKVDILREVAEQELPSSPAFVNEDTVSGGDEDATQPSLIRRVEEKKVDIKMEPMLATALKPSPSSISQLHLNSTGGQATLKNEAPILPSPLPAPFTASLTANLASALPYLDPTSLELPTNPLLISSEDEIFGQIVALKLSRLDGRLKELAKVRLLHALYEVQFGSAAAAVLSATSG